MADDSKFSHLLQPIRDLASNWNVNIADDLEDYLEELENITFAFEDGPSLNFAEAALLIQGSACVYSKKVEYLHSLVYRALELLTQKRQQQEASRKQRQANAEHAGGDADDDDDEESFLNVDELLQDGKDIDLTPDTAASVAQCSKRPALLLAFENYGSNKGDGDSGLYMVQRCTMHVSGALLLEPADGDMYDDCLRPCGRGQNSAAWACGPPQAPGNGPQGADEQPLGDGGDYDMGDFGGGAGSDSDDGGGGGFDGGGGCYSPVLGGEDGALAQHVEGGAPAPADAPPGGGAADAQAAQPQEQEQGEEEFFDPYAPLDPHARGGLPLKPYAKRKPRRRAPPPPADGWSPSLPLAPPPASAALLAFPEFRAAERALLAALRAAARPGGRAARGGAAGAPAAAASGWGFQMGAAADGGMELGALEDEEEEAGDAGLLGDAFGGDAGGELGCDPGGGDDSDDDGDIAVGSFGDDYWGSGEYGGGGGEWGGGVGGGGDGELSYEELCRAHIEAFINAAAAAQVESELSTRVGGWQARIQPLLEEQDARPEFDIHVYGKRLLGRLADLALDETAAAAAAADDAALKGADVTPVPLGDVFACETRYDVSRMFSSMLQLINNGNITVTQGGGVPSLQLHKLRLAHERFEADELLPPGGGAAKAGKAGALAAGGSENLPAEVGVDTAAGSPAPKPQAKKSRAGGRGRRKQ